MAGSSIDRRKSALKRVAALVMEALDLIDAHDGPPHVSAHLDLALQRLREELGS